MKRFLLLIPVLACALAGWYWWTAASVAPAQAARPPALVALATVASSDVPLHIETSGNLTASQNVDVRPQVEGIVSRVLVQEGQSVMAGTALFQLEDAAQQAARHKAEAQRLRDAVQLAQAERKLQRSEALWAQKLLSQNDLDVARSEAEALRATVAADQEAIKAAEIEWQQRTVKAVIAGRVGSINVFPGSVVQPGMATPMVALTQADPVTATFTIPESQLPAVLSAQQQGALAVRTEVNGQRVQGTLRFIDNAVDTRTGMIRLKADFSNPDQRLWPGQFIRVQLDAGVRSGLLTVPVTAVQSGPEGKFAYVVVAGEKPDSLVVQVKPLQLQEIAGDRAVIVGLVAGDRVVASGGQNLRPGAPVRLADSAAPASGKQP